MIFVAITFNDPAELGLDNKAFDCYGLSSGPVIRAFIERRKELRVIPVTDPKS
jgi:hypothetical protein